MYKRQSGNWTQQWVTLRNLAQLLRRLGDNQPAALLDTAAEQAPDAPATSEPANPLAAVAASTRPPVPPPPPTVSRARALQVARQAIDDRLTEFMTGNGAAGGPPRAGCEASGSTGGVGNEAP